MKNALPKIFRSCPDLFVPLISGIFLGMSILIMPDNQNFDNGSFVFAIFAYLISIVYFFARVVPIGLKKNKAELKVSLKSAVIIWLSTAFISCFTLNRSMNVFDDSVLWYSIFVVCFTTAFISRAVYSQFNNTLRFILDAFLGTGSLLMLYLIVALSSWYAIGVVGFFLLGFSLHVFVPLAILIFIAKTISVEFKHKAFRIGYLSGVFLSLSLLIYFGAKWKISGDAINKIHQESLFEHTDDELPMMMEMAQKIPTDGMAGKFLKADIVYNTFDTDNIFSMRFDRFNFNEPRRHDPLVAIFSNLVVYPEITKEDRIELLNFLFRGRHLSERKFWDGDDIRTTKIAYETQLFPEYRLAYTEMLLQMQVKKNHQSWSAQQEALYTFFLPEGTSVTSLSLWVNGKEEKSVLTTKSKADSAYSDIVGVQMRDPSLVHWKEGNTITVRVFPVTFETPRQIRIGFTSPLHKIGNKLRYDNIPFQGPDATNADWNVAFTQKGSMLPISSSIKFKTENNRSIYEGKPGDNWYIETDAPILNSNSFSFNGFNYSAQEAFNKNIPFICKSVILDVNKTWNKGEVESIFQNFDKKSVSCWNGKNLVQGDDPSFDQLIADRMEYNFSLLPFHKITDSAHTLVITKGNITGPFLDELKDSDLANNIKSYFSKGNKPYVFSLQGESSVFIKTLAELRLVQYASGDNEKLKSCLKGSFPKVEENDSTLFIASADMTISKTVDKAKSAADAPDHLMRLFAYNKVLQLIGASYFDESYELDEPVRLAAEANVVSPVSSLIVLETKEDYEKYDIKADPDGLGNASLKNAGAVPEPHEWLLIILTAGGLLYYFIRRKKTAL
jgi:XrtN system VIT domain protein